MNTSPSTPNSPGDSAAIVALEEKLTFQQRQLDQFNDVVLEQQAEINRLRREVNTLSEVVRGALEHDGEDLPHEKPPHY
jgi:SlyX protein